MFCSGLVYVVSNLHYRPGEFPTQRPVTRSFNVFFDLRLNKRLSKQPCCWWFETPSWSLWLHCNDGWNHTDPWGLLSQFSPFRYFPHFPLLSKQTLAIEYHVYIWQVSPQLSCGDTCQIWMGFRESNGYFCKIENFASGQISERSLSNPHPKHITKRETCAKSCGCTIFVWSAVI